MTILWALPTCLVWLENYSWPWTKGSIKLLGMDKMGRWIKRRPSLALLVSALALAFTLPGISRIMFDDDQLALKPEGLEALEVQQDLARAFGSDQEYVIIALPSTDVETLFRKGQITTWAISRENRLSASLLSCVTAILITTSLGSLLRAWVPQV